MRQPSVGDLDEVLDAEPAEPATIEAWLDRHDVAGSSSSALDDLRGEGVLVDVEADAVAGAVEEPVAVAARRRTCSRQAASTSRAATPGAHGVEPGELGLEDQLVDRAAARRRLADDERAGHVGVVAVDERADVDDRRCRPRRSCAGRSGGGGGRRCRARWRRSCRSSGRRRRARRMRYSSSSRDVGLGRAAAASSGATVGQRGVGDRRGGGDAGELALVLDPPQRRSIVAVVGAERRASLGQVGPSGVGQVVGLGARRRRDAGGGDDQWSRICGRVRPTTTSRRRRRRPRRGRRRRARRSGRR